MECKLQKRLTSSTIFSLHGRPQSTSSILFTYLIPRVSYNKPSMSSKRINRSDMLFTLVQLHPKTGISLAKGQANARGKELMDGHSPKEAVVSTNHSFLSLARESVNGLDIPAATYPCIPGLHALGRFNPIIPVYFTI